MLAADNLRTNIFVSDSKDLQLVCHESAEEFLDRFQRTEIARAAINHNLLQIATALASSNELYKPPYCFWTLEEEAVVLGAAIYATPDGLVVSDVPSKVLGTLANSLLAKEPHPSRIIADPIVAEELVDCILRTSGTRMTASIGWHVGKLDAVDRPKASAPGHLRQARRSDRDFVVSWGGSYEKEKSAFLDVAKFMSSKLTAGDLYIWEDDVPTTIRQERLWCSCIIRLYPSASSRVRVRVDRRRSSMRQIT